MTSHVIWKDKTFNQILTTIRKNDNHTIISPANMHNAPPLKIYRKEISPQNTIKSSRIGITINSFEIPNGYTIPINGNSNSSPTTYLDMKINDDKNVCSIAEHGVCFSPQQNAKRRIRTSGVIKNNYNMDTKQYLQRRNLSFEQNQYNFLQSGNSAVKPGSAASLLNIYTMQSSPSSDCVQKTIVVYKPKNSQFAQNGAVSSSSLIARKKYNVITSNAHEYLLPYGAAVANAMNYSISDSAYTYKSKLAFTVKRTPMVNKHSTIMTFCENVSSHR